MMRFDMSESSSSDSSASAASLTRFAASSLSPTWFDISMLHEFNVTLSHVSGPARAPEYILNASLVAFGQGSRYYVSKSYSSLRGFRRALARAVSAGVDGGCRCQGTSCIFAASADAHLSAKKLSCIEILGIGIRGSSEKKQNEVASFVAAVATTMHAVDKSLWSNQCQFLKLVAFFFETMAQASCKAMKASRSRNLNLTLKGWHHDRTKNYGAGITYD
ncbi:Aste57867_16286 [Aphanomyces stellatus]|uniref:Aste57867_16286 protein n=1 Tax=Aphanomyces stellatus TaxID=120398 RepID=A0A485L629_9STRA|nr:hypothetical protein As57867_016229 [Aphanomyces stellatus]VFT93062.1 Aste57867_16286 [Aphanomyces stellatus]